MTTAANSPCMFQLTSHEIDSMLRAEIIAEAESWTRTPYIRRGMIKGVGADCGTFPYAVYRKFDLVPEMKREDVPTLEDGWFCHTSEQRYVRLIERYWRHLVTAQARMEKQPEYLPANLVLVRGYGSRVFNHAGIIVDWPVVIHCAPESGVIKVNAAHDPFWAYQEIAVFEVLHQ